MKVFLVATLAIACVASAPSDRKECPTLDQIAGAFEAEFGSAIPDGALDCLHGGDKCPWSSFENFQSWFKNATGLKLPSVDEEFKTMVFDCLTHGKDCPSLDEAVKFVQKELEVDLDDKLMDTIYNCAEDFVKQLGFGHLLNNTANRKQCPNLKDISIPSIDEDLKKDFSDCVLNGKNCPSKEEVEKFIKKELKVKVDEEVAATISECAEDFLKQLLATVANRKQCPNLKDISIPSIDEDLKKDFSDCVLNGKNCPSKEEVEKFIKKELKVKVDEEVVATISECAEDFLKQLLNHSS